LILFGERKHVTIKDAAQAAGISRAEYFFLCFWISLSLFFFNNLFST
jgi:hypothetical protein